MLPRERLAHMCQDGKLLIVSRIHKFASWDHISLAGAHPKVTATTTSWDQGVYGGCEQTHPTPAFH